MNISATFPPSPGPYSALSQSVRIVDVQGNGNTAYVTFIDGQGNLRVMQSGIGGGFDTNTSAYSIIATGATGS